MQYQKNMTALVIYDSWHIICCKQKIIIDIIITLKQFFFFCCSNNKNRNTFTFTNMCTCWMDSMLEFSPGSACGVTSIWIPWAHLCILHPPYINDRTLGNWLGALPWIRLSLKSLRTEYQIDFGEPIWQWMRLAKKITKQGGESEREIKLISVRKTDDCFDVVEYWQKIKKFTVFIHYGLI